MFFARLFLLLSCATLHLTIADTNKTLSDDMTLLQRLFFFVAPAPAPFPTSSKERHPNAFGHRKPSIAFQPVSRNQPWWSASTPIPRIVTSAKDIHDYILIMVRSFAMDGVVDPQCVALNANHPLRLSCAPAVSGRLRSTADDAAKAFTALNHTYPGWVHASSQFANAHVESGLHSSALAYTLAMGNDCAFLHPLSPTFDSGPPMYFWKIPQKVSWCIAVPIHRVQTNSKTVQFHDHV